MKRRFVSFAALLLGLSIVVALFATRSHPVLFEISEPGDPQGPEWCLLNPFRDRGPERAAVARESILDAGSLKERIVEAPLPPYPELARKANVEGSVVLEVVVLGSGDVGCVRLLRSVAFGIGDRLAAAALDWRFDPSRPSPIPAPFVGRLTVEYRWVEEGHSAY